VALVVLPFVPKDVSFCTLSTFFVVALLTFLMMRSLMAMTTVISMFLATQRKSKAS